VPVDKVRPEQTVNRIILWHHLESGSDWPFNSFGYIRGQGQYAYDMYHAIEASDGCVIGGLFYEVLYSHASWDTLTHDVVVGTGVEASGEPLFALDIVCTTINNVSSRAFTRSR
jgi:hypothetical protein